MGSQQQRPGTKYILPHFHPCGQVEMNHITSIHKIDQKVPFKVWGLSQEPLLIYFGFKSPGHFLSLSSYPQHLFDKASSIFLHSMPWRMRVVMQTAKKGDSTLFAWVASLPPLLPDSILLRNCQPHPVLISAPIKIFYVRQSQDCCALTSHVKSGIPKTLN